MSFTYWTNLRRIRDGLTNWPGPLNLQVRHRQHCDATLDWVTELPSLAGLDADHALAARYLKRLAGSAGLFWFNMELEDRSDTDALAELLGVTKKWTELNLRLHPTRRQRGRWL